LALRVAERAVSPPVRAQGERIKESRREGRRGAMKKAHLNIDALALELVVE
jgi:hypothetical protein